VLRTTVAVAVAALLAGPRIARADVTIKIDPGAGAPFAQQAGIDLSAIEMQLRDELTRVFQTSRVQEYIQGFGNAQAFTTRGLGVDYASNIKTIMVGVGANVSLNVEKGFVPKDTRSRPPINGVGTNVSFMAGTNLRWLGLRPVTVFGNYFQQKGSLREFSSDVRNAGGHVQLKLFGPKNDESFLNAVLKWGGIDITSGFDYAAMHLSLREDLSNDIPVGGAAKGARIVVKSRGLFDIDMKTLSVPLEVTTNFRVLYLASVYGGLGFDWQFAGENKMELSLNGTMTGTAGGMSADLGTVTASAKGTAAPSVGKLRGILGIQANLWLVKVYAQLNAMPDAGLFGMAFGLRIAY
jgi:hypothetical protein